MKAKTGIQYLYTISTVRAKATTLLRWKLPSVFRYTEAVPHGLSIPKPRVSHRFGLSI